MSTMDQKPNWELIEGKNPSKVLKYVINVSERLP